MFEQSRINVALIFFTATLLSSAFGMITVMSIYGPEYSLYATKLEAEPDTNFLLENADNYVLEAVNNPETSIVVGRTLGNTQIDELMSMHNTSNVEYNNSYYRIQIIVGDNFPPAGLSLLLPTGILVSLVAVVILSSSKAAKCVRNRNGNLRE
jgi:uncharacterized protein YlzI (FlbEa/FlbD family)